MKTNVCKISVLRVKNFLKYNPYRKEYFLHMIYDNESQLLPNFMFAIEQKNKKKKSKIIPFTC